MKIYPARKTRNVGLFGHGDSGKTSVAEAMLFVSGAVTRLGNVDDENTVSDYDPDELKRKLSVYSTPVPFEWSDHKFNIIDTPGFADFMGEVMAALRAVDSAVFTVSAVSGVEVQTEIIWEMAADFDKPCAIFINKMDRENADFTKVLDELKESFGRKVVQTQIPIGSQNDFEGVVDLISGKAYMQNSGPQEACDIPENLSEQYQDAREKLIEMIAETDDDLIEKYLEGEELSEEKLMLALKNAVLNRDLFPVLCGSATKLICMQTLMGFLKDIMPSADIAKSQIAKEMGNESEIEIKPDNKGPLCALVFRTVSDPYVGKLTYFKVFSGTVKSDSTIYNASKQKEERIGQVFLIRGKTQEPVSEIPAGDIGAVAKVQSTATGDTLTSKEKQMLLDPIVFPEPIMSLSVEPLTKGDEDKLSTALSRLVEEDPTYVTRRDPELKQTIISGMGEAHLDILVERLQRKFGVEVNTNLPKVPYKESIRKKAQAEGKHKKQTGGHGQFGIAFVEIEPLERGSGFEFIDKIVGGVIPKQFIPAVEKGIREIMEEGILAGYEIVDMRAKLYDGKYHPVDSSEMSFKIAGTLAIKGAFADADPYLLEPIVNVEVTVPEAYMGDVIGDLNSKRGRIMGVEPKGNFQVIKAQVPQAEMFRYSIDLRSITGGRGIFKFEYSHYEEVPAHISSKIIDEAKKEKEAEKK